MTRRWQLQEAKNKFSEVVDAALNQGPQVITRHGVETAIVLSYAAYRKLQLTQAPLSKFFHESPLADVELDLSRDSSQSRATLEL